MSRWGGRVLVETFIAELTVEALDKANLQGLARLDQPVLEAVLLGLGDAGATGELRSVVGAYGLRISTEAGGLGQQAHHVYPTARCPRSLG